jgi:RNA polymerase sigma-70 factor (ECF subfamily)
MSDSFEQDARWLQAWRGGDQASGDALARKHYASVHRFFEVKATAVADDLTQRTFLECARVIGRLERSASFRSFLFGIARNLLRQHIDRRRRKPTEAADFDDVPGRRTRLSSLVARQIEQQIVLRALAELSDDFAEVLQLYYWEGMSAREIGEVVGATATLVSTRLHRARQQLRETADQLAVRPELKRRLAVDLENVTRSIAGVSGDESR